MSRRARPWADQLQGLEDFLAVRPRLLSLAYRMTGSRADAEDLVHLPERLSPGSGRWSYRGRPSTIPTKRSPGCWTTAHLPAAARLITGPGSALAMIGRVPEWTPRRTAGAWTACWPGAGQGGPHPDPRARRVTDRRLISSGGHERPPAPRHRGRWSLHAAQDARYRSHRHRPRPLRCRHRVGQRMGVPQGSGCRHQAGVLLPPIASGPSTPDAHPRAPPSTRVQVEGRWLSSDASTRSPCWTWPKLPVLSTRPACPPG